MQRNVNTKIVLHWILIILLSLIVIFFIELNSKVVLIFTSLMISTLVINQLTFISINKNQLVIVSKILFIIPVSIKRIDISAIKELSFIDYTANEFEVDFEGAVISKLITGKYFYESKYGVRLLYENKEYESNVCISENNLKSIKSALKEMLDNRFVE